MVAGRDCMVFCRPLVWQCQANSVSVRIECRPHLLNYALALDCTAARCLEIKNLGNTALLPGSCVLKPLLKFVAYVSCLLRWASARMDAAVYRGCCFCCTAWLAACSQSASFKKGRCTLINVHTEQLLLGITATVAAVLVRWLA